MKTKPLEIEFDGDELVAAVQDTVKLGIQRDAWENFEAVSANP